MCLPVAAMAAAAGAAGTASTALTVGSSIFGALSAYQAAQSQRANLRAQAAAADYNASVSDAQAQREAERGVREQERIGRQVADVRGRQRAALAANGLDVNSGTPAALQDQTDYYGMQDMLTAGQNATESAAALRGQAGMQRMQAGNARSQAGAVSPWLSAGTSLLGGAAKVAERWATYNPDPVPTVDDSYARKYARGMGR